METGIVNGILPVGLKRPLTTSNNASGAVPQPGISTYIKEQISTLLSS